MTSESDFIKTVFGLKLRQQRQKKDWSLQDLADKTKLSKSYLNEIENGKKYPKHDKILQLAEVLNCKFDDLVSTKLAMPEDLEESALTITGKKNRLKRADFDELATKLGIPVKSSERVYAKFVKKQTAMLELIGQSFLSDEMKAEYAKLLIKRIEMLNV